MLTHKVYFGTLEKWQFFTCFDFIIVPFLSLPWKHIHEQVTMRLLSPWIVSYYLQQKIVRVGLMISRGHFQSQLFCDSVIIFLPAVLSGKGWCPLVTNCRRFEWVLGLSQPFIYSIFITDYCRQSWCQLAALGGPYFWETESPSVYIGDQSFELSCKELCM